MLGHASYPYTPQMASTTQRYSGTSSAFSASANPNEDWTKISDLAERRRIQNRIAQRNYRKKLKKRLEDLERRAASNSASPEQRPAELHRPSMDMGVSDASIDSSNRRSPMPHSQSSHSSQSASPATHFYGNATTDDRVMFSQQYTRQLSTSPPPPFPFSGFGPDPAVNYATYAQQQHQQQQHQQQHAQQQQPPQMYTHLSSAATTESLFAPYLPPPPSSLASHHAATFQLPSMGYPAAASKQEFYADDEMSPFSMSYASMAGIDVPSAQAYQDNVQLHTPPLSDSFEHSIAGSPPELYNPTTPASMPGTPPLRLV